MTNECKHSHSVSIDPRELSADAVLVSIDLQEKADCKTATRRAEIVVVPHDSEDKDVTSASPIEYVLLGLALSTAQAIKLAIITHDLKVKKLFVAVSQQQHTERSGSITREIIIDGGVSDEERNVLEQFVSRCPISCFLISDHIIETVVA